MKAEVLSVDSPVWASFLSEVRHDFHHLPAYLALCAAQEEGRPVALHVVEGGRRMLLPLVVRPIPGGGQDVTSPYGYPGPLASGPDDVAFMEAALIRATQLLRTMGSVSLFVRLHPLLNQGSFSGVGQVVQSGEVVSIDLGAPMEELWQQTRYDHRTQIRRALKNGREAYHDESWSRYDEFKRLYRATMARVAASDYYFFDDAYFDGLRDALAERLRLWVIEVDGVLAAGALFVETCGIVQFHLSGTDPTYGREGLMKLLIHTVRSWAKERGNVEMHLGGGVGAAEDSLMLFKSGFSPRRLPFRTLRVVIDPAAYSRLVEARVGVSGGSRSSDFFPEYRAPATSPSDSVD
jgi:hypothetical protein